MKCPCCGNQMTRGYIQSVRNIVFTTQKKKPIFNKDLSADIVLNTDNLLTNPTCVAYHCVDCKKVVVDYSVEVE